MLGVTNRPRLRNEDVRDNIRILSEIVKQKILLFISGQLQPGDDDDVAYLIQQTPIPTQHYSLPQVRTHVQSHTLIQLLSIGGQP